MDNYRLSATWIIYRQGVDSSQAVDDTHSTPKQRESTRRGQGEKEMRNLINSINAAYNRTRVSRWDTEWVAVAVGGIGAVVVVLAQSVQP